ncbi:putative sensor domain DACNV-containing protein [Pedobacter immunditicola]|uniref:putative sensor domain DACNV-containing protein n=1 Tax=Pedobacter immunditicola TaxID=3133440 RepID=UPI0030B50F53
MIYQSTYQAARIVAPKLEAIFAEHLKTAKESGEDDLAPLPEAHFVEHILDATFWASLRKEEGHPTKISLAFVSPEQAGNPLLLKHHLPLNPSVLTKLAPGVERPGIHIGVWHDGNDLYVWGTTIIIPNYCFVLDVSEPGLLVIKHRRIYGFGKYTNVAVLKGEQIKIVDTTSPRSHDWPTMLLTLLDLMAPSYWNDSVNVLIQIAVSMRAHQRGGIMLVVPSENNNWLQSIVKPIIYSVQPSFSGLSKLLIQDRKEASQIFWQTALRREVDHLAGLTAVDGATVVNERFELLAFGAKIGRAKGKDILNEVSFSEPIVDGGAIKIPAAKIGGTRHLSAAQFINDQKDALALVASQDGHFTIFSWSEQSNCLQAHRIDTLLL